MRSGISSLKLLPRLDLLPALHRAVLLHIAAQTLHSHDKTQLQSPLTQQSHPNQGQRARSEKEGQINQNGTAPPTLPRLRARNPRPQHNPKFQREVPQTPQRLRPQKRLRTGRTRTVLLHHTPADPGAPEMGSNCKDEGGVLAIREVVSTLWRGCEHVSCRDYGVGRGA